MRSSNATSFRGIKKTAARVLNRALTMVAPAVSEFRDLDVEGLDHVPATGAVLIACNHRLPIDAAIVQAALDRDATVVGVQRWWPNPDADEQHRVEALMRGGAALLGFPEITPSPDGRLHRGHIGLGALVLAHELTVIPAATADQGRSVRFGAPISFERHHGLPVTRTLARSITDEVMERILLLSGQTYSDTTSAGARAEGRRAQRQQITARKMAAAAKRQAVRVADAARRQGRAEEREDLRRRAEEAEAVARARAAEAASRDRRHFAGDQTSPNSSRESGGA